MGDKKNLLIILILVGLVGLSFRSNHAGAQTPAVAAQPNPSQIEPQAGTPKAGAPPFGGQLEGDTELWVTAQASSQLFILKGEGAPVEMVTLPMGTGPHMTTFAPSGKFAYVAGMGNGDLFIIRADDRQTVQVLDLGPAGTHQAKPSPDGSVLLIAQVASSSLIKVAADEAMESWKVAGDALSFAPQGKRPICTVFRDDGRRAYVSLLPDGLAIVDVATMTVLKILPTDGFIACGMIKARDGKVVTIASSGGGGHIYRLDTTTDELSDAGTLGAADWHSFHMRSDHKVGFGTSPTSDELQVFDLEGAQVRKVATVALDPTPGIGNDQPDALDVEGDTLYVSLRKSGKLALIDANQLTVRYVDLAPPTAADIPLTCDTCVLHGVTVRK